jgi:hypothetical protein
MGHAHDGPDVAASRSEIEGSTASFGAPSAMCQKMKERLHIKQLTSQRQCG